VRDAVNLSRRNIPAVALVTSEFWAQGDFIARAAGLPDVPRVQLPHPVASTGRDHMRQVALDIRDAIVTALRGSDVETLEGTSPTGSGGAS
jgi:hypothetical protein